MGITERFIVEVLNVLPEDGLKKLNKLVDEDEVTEESLTALLAEYNIDPLKILRNSDEEAE